MKNLAPKLSPEQYEQNFAEIHPPFTPNSAVAEANRCLYCFDSPCMKACPTRIDISTFIKKIATENLKGSARTILKANWIRSGDTAAFHERLATLVNQAWRISIAKYEPVSFIPWP
jgi:NADPH-dependent glutamate synthase beta subunit-like oxidoreductase